MHSNAGLGRRCRHVLDGGVHLGRFICEELIVRDLSLFALRAIISDQTNVMFSALEKSHDSKAAWDTKDRHATPQARLESQRVARPATAAYLVKRGRRCTKSDDTTDHFIRAIAAIDSQPRERARSKSTGCEPRWPALLSSRNLWLYVVATTVSKVYFLVDVHIMKLSTSVQIGDLIRDTGAGIGALSVLLGHVALDELVLLALPPVLKMAFRLPPKTEGRSR